MSDVALASCDFSERADLAAFLRPFTNRAALVWWATEQAWGLVPGVEVGDAQLRAASTGRVAWPTGELRWRWLDAGVGRLRYLGEEPPPARLAATASTAGWRARKLRYLLWGERDADGLYRTARLPRPLGYPGVTGDRAWLGVVQYLAAGAVVAERWTGLHDKPLNLEVGP